MDKPDEVREKAVKLLGVVWQPDSPEFAVDAVLAYRQSCINEGLRMAAEHTKESMWCYCSDHITDLIPDKPKEG